MDGIRFIGILDEKKIGNGIIIYSHTMTPAAKKVMPRLWRYMRRS